MAKEYLKVIGCDEVPIIERDEEWDKDRWVAVSVVTSPYVPIETTLLSRGFKAVIPFYDLTECFRDKHPLSNGWFANPLTVKDQHNINTVLKMWADDTSRAHHLQFMAWRRAREEWSFDTAPIPDCKRFFIPEVTRVLHDREIFIDAGACYGDVTKAFVEITKGKYKRIHAIEPDTLNRKVYETVAPPSTRIHTFALAEHEGIANFHSGLGFASQLSTTGHDYVITYPLDALKLDPTFIKLHLEGAELAALMGAKRTLMAHRPILAVTVYHNEDGMWKTPLWLMNFLSDYHFYFRLHSWCGTGAVVYAIPIERNESRH